MEEPRNVYWVPVRRKHNLDIEADSSSHHHHNHHTTTTGAGAAAAFATFATSSSTHTFTRRQVVGSSGDLGTSTSTTADVMSTVITAVIIFIIISTSLLGLYIWRHGRQRKPWTSSSSWQAANDGMGQQQMQQQGRGEEGEGEEQWISGDGIAARYAHHSYRDAPLLAWNEKSQVYERTSDVASSLGVNHVLTDDDGDYFFPPNASITHSRGAV